jgi:hypothetical protein
LLRSALRQNGLTQLIDNVNTFSGDDPQDNHKQLQDHQFRIYTTYTEIETAITSGHPLSAIVWGSQHDWHLGVVVRQKKQWFCSELLLSPLNVNDTLDGFAYFDIRLDVAAHEVVIQSNDGPGADNSIPVMHNRHVWDYCILLPHLWNANSPGYKFAVLQKSWRRLDSGLNWIIAS